LAVLSLSFFNVKLPHSKTRYMDIERLNRVGSLLEKIHDTELGPNPWMSF
jgi:hypothetical protein